MDGIRGLAILGVMLVHFNKWRPALAGERLVADLLGALWIGVDIFFVLSGFLITGILVDAKAAPKFFSHFYARRALRILPLYYGSLVVLLLGGRLLGYQASAEYHTLVQNQVWLWTYTSNILVGLDGWQAAPFTSHFWSLAIEEQFYLLWPVAVFVCGRKALWRLCLLGALGSVAFRGLWLGFGLDVSLGFMLLPAQCDALLAGGALALLLRSSEGLKPLVPYAPWALLSALSAWSALVLSVRRGFTDHPFALWAMHEVAVLLAVSLIVIATALPGQGVLRGMLENRVLVMLGKYSYGLYVFHFPIAVLAGRKLFPLLVQWSDQSQLGAQLLYLTLAGGASLVVALLSWHLYEQPFLRLKDLFRAEPRRTPIEARHGHAPAPAPLQVVSDGGRLPAATSDDREERPA